MKLTVKLFWLNGIFPVYKPSGITSSDVVGKLKCILSNQGTVKNTKYHIQKYKVGHGGVLDKAAEGVLVIGVGQGTKKLSEYLTGDKSYNATGEFGVTTDTLDRDGTITDRKPFDFITQNDLIMTLKSFEGQQSQIPPLYSALKVKGRRVSDLARQGLEIDMKTKERSITIHCIALKRFELPIFEIEVSCSSGTYIRSLIRDIGQRLDTVAYMTHLCRTRQGRYLLAEALPQEKWTFDNVKGLLHPI